jgi:acetyltransferase
MFGLGGIFVEAMKDVSFRIHPITDLDAREMITSIRGYPLLKGFRGEKGVNLKLLEEMLLRLSQLLSDFPEIGQIDINPFIAGSGHDDSFAVDARISLLSS